MNSTDWFITAFCGVSLLIVIWFTVFHALPKKLYDQYRKPFGSNDDLEAPTPGNHDI